MIKTSGFFGGVFRGVLKDMKGASGGQQYGLLDLSGNFIQITWNKKLNSVRLLVQIIQNHFFQTLGPDHTLVWQSMLF